MRTIRTEKEIKDENYLRRETREKRAGEKKYN